MKSLLTDTAALSDVSAPALLSDRRDTATVTARFAFCWVAREVLCLSYSTIGRFLGDRDHSTILHAVRRAVDLRADSDFRSLTDLLSEGR